MSVQATSSDSNRGPASRLAACHCCGLVQRLPEPRPQMRACCVRCESNLNAASGWLSDPRLTAALALAALILYVPGVTLPMLSVEKFGYRHETGVVSGCLTLIGGGHLLVGLIVLVCSIVFPLGKLTALFVLCAGSGWMRGAHRAWTYRVVEWTGRWGMLDVLLVAVLVAAVKVSDLIDVSAGPAALAFCGCVVLSLLATATFHPHALWRNDPAPAQRVKKV